MFTIYFSLVQDVPYLWLQQSNVRVGKFYVVYVCLGNRVNMQTHHQCVPLTPLLMCDVLSLPSSCVLLAGLIMPLVLLTLRL